MIPDLLEWYANLLNTQKCIVCRTVLTTHMRCNLLVSGYAKQQFVLLIKLHLA